MSRNRISGLIYIIIGVLILLAVFQFYQKPSTSKHPLMENVSNELNNIDTLKIESSVTAIHIIETSDPFLTATLEQSNTSDKNRLTLVATNDHNSYSLEVVNQRSKFSLLSLNSFNSTLHVNIPKNYNGKLEVDTSTGTIEIKQLELDELKVETTTGTVRLNNVYSENIQLESTTGTIHVNDVEANKLKAESTTGTIRLNSKLTSVSAETTTGSIHFEQDDIYADSKLESTTGSIHVSLKQQPSSLNVKFETATGNAHIKTTGHNMIQNSKNEQEFQFGSGETSLKVETTTGSFHFE